MDKFVFWRVVFDVVDHQIRLWEEITCWELVGGDPYWRRNNRLIVDLPYQIMGYVNVLRDIAEFRGGYIECQTYDLRDFQLNCLGTLGSGTSIPFDGENISIRADVRLLDEVGMSEYPFFYLDQLPLPEGEPPPEEELFIPPVSLTEQLVPIPNQPPVQQVLWEIGGWQYSARYTFGLTPLGSWHRLRVHQDDGPDPDTSVFKFWVDAIPLKHQPNEVAPGMFQFDSMPQRLLIGGKPDPHGDIIGLYGDIAYLEFDPNDSCRRCLMDPTGE